jgi:hypothetical protein
MTAKTEQMVQSSTRFAGNASRKEGRREMKLTSMERDILDMLVNGRTHWSDTGSKIAWGAAMSVIIETLHEAGLVTYPDVKATEAGRIALDAMSEAAKQNKPET